MNFLRWAAVTLAAFVLVTGPARAHPHVWIKSQIQLNMKGGKIVSISLKWRFDPLFSGLLMTNFDHDKNRKFSKEEVADLRKRAFSNLVNHGYFTQAWADKKALKLKKVSAFNAGIAEETVTYSFTIVLPEAIDPRKQKAAFRFLDESYYVAVDFGGGKSIRLTGEGSDGCTHKVEQDKANPIYSGLVIPDVVRINCAAS